jgi:hypothetical protein
LGAIQFSEVRAKPIRLSSSGLSRGPIFPLVMVTINVPVARRCGHNLTPDLVA